MLGVIRRAASTAVIGARKTEELIGKLPIFSRLGPKQIRKLARLTSPRRYSASETIIQKGDMGLGLYAIVSGKAEVFDQCNGTRIHLGTVGPGDCVGEMSLIDDQPRSASIRVVEDAECLILIREDFKRLVRRDPEILRGILPVILQRLRQSNRRLAELSAQVAEYRRRPEAPALLVVPDYISDSAPQPAPAQGPAAQPEAVTEDRNPGFLAPILQLSSASLLFASSLLLFSTQEAIRLMAGTGSLTRRVGDSNAAVSAVAKRVEDNMSGPTHQMLNLFRGLLSSIDSVINR